jgi:diguanylate cyclase (GGDEF)-like protein/PAS domain S-box-containing protein
MKAFRVGLISKIALLVIGIEIAAFGALGWFYIDRYSTAVDEQLRSRMHVVANLVANDELAISALSRKDLVSGLVGAPLLHGMVVGGSGRVIVATDPENLGRPVERIPGVDARWFAETAPLEQVIVGTDTLTGISHIRSGIGSSSIYHTIITISTAEVEAQKRHIVLWGEVGSALFILLSSAGIILVAQRLITRRVVTSLAILKNVQEGNLNARIPVVSEDEFGQLQHGINTMTEKVGLLLDHQRKIADDLQSQKDLLLSVVENAPIRVFWKDPELRYLGCNSLFAHDAGVAHPEDLIGKTDFNMSWRDQAMRYQADDLAVMKSEISKLDYEELQTTPDGSAIWLSTSKVPLRGKNQRVIGVLGIYTDITSRKRAEEQIHNLAYFDPLTGLPNRTLLLDRLKQCMSTCKRTGAFGAVQLIDLDNFKTLNDTLGHDMGDTLLKQVAQRLTQCVREVDTVARLGGDEFVVVIGGMGTDERAATIAIETVAEKILSTLGQPYQLGNALHHSTASIGVSFFKDELATVDDLMKQADLAMYKAKENGRNLVRFFNPIMESALKERTALEDDLRRAIEEKQFLLHYQAQIVGGQLTGAEVLIRWQHPQRGLVSPAEFIPMAEESGLILPLGNWVLETACAQLTLWASSPEMSRLTVAVNVSAHQFRQSGFVDQVLAILKKTNANPRRLKLELTESLLVSNVDEVIEKMFALKAKGVGFSLDDFGTGYSSLSYLKLLPLDQLKIDQSFVRDVLIDPNDASIAKTIIVLAQNLGLGVIAEGVETAAQRDFLANLGCIAYQGYFFSRPLPIEDFEMFAQKV